MKKLFRSIIINIIILLCVSSICIAELQSGSAVLSAADFSPRTTAPSTSDFHYFSDNVFYKSGYGMPNCTAYAYGRAYEILNSKPNLCTGNAGQWYSYNKNNGFYSYGSIPKLGAVACWDKYDSNQGHVAVVEAINGDNITISESHYQSTFFDTRTIKKDSSNYLTSMRFLGYIYIGDFSDDTTPPTISNARVIAADANGYMLECTVTDNVDISSVVCATWTLVNGDDDILWTDMVNVENNTWKLYISYADHGNQKNVEYANHIYAYDSSGNGVYVIVPFNNWSPPAITDYKIVGVDSGGYMLQCTINDNDGISSVKCATWTEHNGHDDIVWTDMVNVENNTWKLYIPFSEHNNEVDRYYNDIYAYDSMNQGTFVSIDYNRCQNIGNDFYAIVKNIGYKTALTNIYGDNDYYVTGLSSGQNAQQLWRFQIGYNNEYTIKSVIDGQAMEIYGASSADGSRPNVLNFNNTDAQKWYISENISGYNIVPKCAVGETLQTHANGNIDIFPIESNRDSQAYEFSIPKDSELSDFYPQIDEVKFYNTNNYTNSATQFYEGDTIYIKNNFKNIPGYDISIYKDNQLFSSQHINISGEEITIKNVSAGNYKVIIKGGNQLKSIEKSSSFNVINKPAIPTAKPTDTPVDKAMTKTKVTVSDGKYILNTKVTNLHEKAAHIIYAAYDKDNALIDITDKNYNGNDLIIEYTDNTKTSYVKVFVWNNFYNIMPLSDNVEHITFK